MWSLRPIVVALGGDALVVVFLRDASIVSECDHKAIVPWVGSALGATNRSWSRDSACHGGRERTASGSPAKAGVAVGVTLPHRWSTSPLRWLLVIMPKVGFAARAIVVRRGCPSLVMSNSSFVDERLRILWDWESESAVVPVVYSTYGHDIISKLLVSYYDV
ncbi:hypothetical protein CRG98_019887 [Punica granatum]|uniref:Uncharacterized protein n=1 Tax=Punica granatum TaxID=22663 RepID=A0A2I0JTW1_PUNGR|nr:hypothetical protein CRG98_019887 [Punica granatum]